MARKLKEKDSSKKRKHGNNKENEENNVVKKKTTKKVIQQNKDIDIPTDSNDDEDDIQLDSGEDDDDELSKELIQQPRGFYKNYKNFAYTDGHVDIPRKYRSEEYYGKPPFFGVKNIKDRKTGEKKQKIVAYPLYPYLPKLECPRNFRYIASVNERTGSAKCVTRKSPKGRELIKKFENKNIQNERRPVIKDSNITKTINDYFYIIENVLSYFTTDKLLNNSNKFLLRVSKDKDDKKLKTLILTKLFIMGFYFNDGDIKNPTWLKMDFKDPFDVSDSEVLKKITEFSKTIINTLQLYGINNINDDWRTLNTNKQITITPDAMKYIPSMNNKFIIFALTMFQNRSFYEFIRKQMEIDIEQMFIIPLIKSISETISKKSLYDDEITNSISGTLYKLSERKFEIKNKYKEQITLKIREIVNDYLVKIDEFLKFMPNETVDINELIPFIKEQIEISIDQFVDFLKTIT